VVGVLALLGASALLFTGEKKDTTTGDAPMAPVDSAMPVMGGNAPEMMVDENPDAPAVDEYTMTAYYDEKGKWFSLKEIAAKKGDTIRLSITNTKGMHNFTLDEYGIKKELPLNEVVVVEFVADKAGEFVYYCAMPGHKAGGQWGTLRVVE